MGSKPATIHQTQIYQIIIKFMIIFLFTSDSLSADSVRHLLQTVTGPNGQDCTPSSTDAPNACPIDSNGNFTSISGTQIECEENFDCCTCSNIRCGSIASNSYCNAFIANGNSSAFYVYPISIIGDPGGDGASIQCNGHQSCEGTQIQGRYIKGVNCTATRSCADTEWFISCSRLQGCPMQCDGIEACTGSFTVLHAVALHCSQEACSKGVFLMHSVSNFTKTIACVGTDACYQSEIEINEVGNVKCIGDYACAEAIMTVTDPVSGFELQCKGYRSCHGLTLVVEISSSSSVNTLKGFDCETEEACKDVNIVIINKSPTDVIIEALNCAAELSCAYATFVVEEVTALVIVEDCDCGNKNGCLGAQQGGAGTPIECIAETTTTEIPTTTTRIQTKTPTTTTKHTPPPITTTRTPTKHSPIPTTTTSIIKTPSPHIASDSSDSSYSESYGSYDSSDVESYDTHDIHQVVASGVLSAITVDRVSIPDVYDGTNVDCNEDRECQGTHIEATYIEKINCGGDFSCAFAQIRVIDPKDAFVIECDGDNACQGLVLEVIVTSDSSVTRFDGIECVSDEACADASISIVNHSPNTVIIEELNCASWRACAGASFNLIGSILFETCQCGDNGCLDTTGIDQCFENLDKLECKESACVGESATIINPSNGFQLVCDELRSCHDFDLTVIINDNANDFPVERIQGVSCGHRASCKGLTLNILNEQTGIVLNVDTIECKGHEACVLALFGGNAAANVVFHGIECNGNCGGKDAILQCRAESNGEQIFCGHSVFT